jgi:hypothetical protein
MNRPPSSADLEGALKTYLGNNDWPSESTFSLVGEDTDTADVPTKLVRNWNQAFRPQNIETHARLAERRVYGEKMEADLY